MSEEKKRKQQEASRPATPAKPHFTPDSLKLAEYMALLESEKEASIGGWNPDNQDIMWQLIERKG